MSDQTLELIIKARDQSNQAFDSLLKSLKQTQQEQEKTKKSTEGLSDRLGKFAGGVDMAAKKLAGLPGVGKDAQEALRGLSDISDVAGVGLENLSQKGQLFSASAVGVAAAGLALGYALGTYLDKNFASVRATADDATRGLYDFLAAVGVFETKIDSAAGKDKGIAAFSAQIGKVNEQAVARQIEGLKKLGLSIEEIQKRYHSAGEEAHSATAIVDRMAEAHKKAADAAKEHAEALKRQAAELAAELKPWRDLLDAQQRAGADQALMDALQALGPLTERSVTEVNRMSEALRKMGDEGDTAARDLRELYKAQTGIGIIGAGKNFGDLLKDVPGMVKPAAKEVQDVFVDLNVETKAWQENLLDVADVLHGIGGKGFGQLGDILGGVVSISDSMKDWKNAGKGFSLDKLAAGFGIAGAAIGIGKSIGGLLGIGGDKEHMQVNDLRDDFVSLHGGIARLNAEAAAAGVTLDRMLRAKTVKDYNAAIDELNEALALPETAIQKTLAAMDEFGISIDQMGPRFAQQQLDKQAMALAEKWDLLHTAGASYDTLVGGMGPKIGELVEQYRAAGVAMPEAFRPVIEQMLQHGEIVDENGNAYKTAEEAGISFAESMTEATKRQADATERLVELLERMLGMSGRSVDIPVNFTGGGADQFRGGGRFEGEGMADGDRTITSWGVPAVLHGSSSNPEFVSRGDQIEEHMERVLQRNGGGGGGALYVQSPPIYLDGQLVARATMRRIDAGKARSKQPLRRMQ